MDALFQDRLADWPSVVTYDSTRSRGNIYAHYNRGTVGNCDNLCCRKPQMDALFQDRLADWPSVVKYDSTRSRGNIYAHYNRRTVGNCDVCTVRVGTIRRIGKDVSAATYTQRHAIVLLSAVNVRGCTSVTQSVTSGFIHLHPRIITFSTLKTKLQCTRS
jgi:hypothetical protein